MDPLYLDPAMKQEAVGYREAQDEFLHRMRTEA